MRFSNDGLVYSITVNACRLISYAMLYFTMLDKIYINTINILYILLR